MKRKSNIRRNLATLGLILICTISVFSQQAKINQKRLTRDLNIMEGVLDKLLQGDTSHRFFDGHTRGVYIPGFGIVFHTRQEGPVIHELNVAMQRQYERVQDMADKVRDEMDEKREEMHTAKELAEEAFITARNEERNLDELEELAVVEEIALDSKKRREEEIKNIETYKNQIFVFFRNYTSAIGQLSPQDRLAVLVNLTGWELAENENTFLTAWVNKDDIDKFRQGQINAQELQKRTHFQLTTDKNEIDSDISILAEILDRAMPSSSWDRSGNSGIYINGLGAVLFVELPRIFHGYGEGISVIVSDNDTRAFTYAPSVGVITKPNKKLDKSFGEKINEVEEELFDLIASYGHTLRIQSGESLILNVNLGSRFITDIGSRGENQPSNLILQLKKKDLDDYNRGALDLSALKRKLVKQTY